MEVPAWKTQAASLNVQLLEQAGLGITEYQEYLYNCLQWFEGTTGPLNPTDRVNALVGMLQHCALFVGNIADDQASSDLHQAIKDWLIVHGPPLCVGSNLTDDGSDDPAADLQLLTILAGSQSRDQETNLPLD